VGRAVQGRHAGRGLFRLFQILIPSRPVSKHGGGPAASAAAASTA
jgi:hypothetical protein